MVDIFVLVSKRAEDDASRAILSHFSSLVRGIRMALGFFSGAATLSATATAPSADVELASGEAAATSGIIVASNVAVDVMGTGTVPVSGVCITSAPLLAAAADDTLLLEDEDPFLLVTAEDDDAAAADLLVIVYSIFS